MTTAASFFARRRAGLQAEALADAAPIDVAEEAGPDLDALPESEVLEMLNLPDPDTLISGDDFTAFMAKSVPAYLRKRALRTLWRSNPVLACVDGLNDYDDDYLAMSKNQGPLQTSYQVGRGLLKHIQDVADKATVDADPVVENIDVAEPEDVVAAVDTPAPYVPPAPSDDIATDPPAPRRMRFDFERDAT